MAKASPCAPPEHDADRRCDGFELRLLAQEVDIGIDSKSRARQQTTQRRHVVAIEAKSIREFEPACNAAVELALAVVVDHAYVDPKDIPPGAFVPGERSPFPKHATGGNAIVSCGMIAHKGANCGMEDFTIAPGAKPRLPRGVRLTHSEAQGGWVLLAPERIFKADAIAFEILRRCTGETTFDALVDDLARTFNAPRERIHADVTKLLASLAEKKLLEL